MDVEEDMTDDKERLKGDHSEKVPEMSFPSSPEHTTGFGVLQAPSFKLD
jgi:hypothetical protein